MQSSDFDPQSYKVWFRRPTIFVTVSWMLLCAACGIIAPKLIDPIANILKTLGIRSSKYRLTLIADALYRILVMLLPPLLYARSHEGVGASLRLKRPNLAASVYAGIIGMALVPLSRTMTVLWTLLLQTLGAEVSYTVRAPVNFSQLILWLVLDGCLSGICLEMMFHGGLFAGWERRGGERALFAITLFYAAFHGSVQEFPVHLIIGLTTGLVTMYSGSVFCGMMSHVFYGGLMIALDAVNGSFETTSLLYAVVQEGRLPSYLASFAFSGALLALLLFIDRLIGRKRGTWSGFLKVERPEAMSASEVLILAVAMLTVLSSCAESFISICRF